MSKTPFKPSIRAMRGVAATVASAALVAAAGVSKAAETDPSNTASVAPPRLRPSATPAFAARPVSLATLAAQRGGEVVTIAAQLQGSVADNSVSQSVTGSNAIGSGAFAGASGIATVIQNTGNNVLIQNAVVVNVQLK